MKNRLPLVAIMGRPNVGKSTLMNRISNSRAAVVDPAPGVTRDRKYVRAKWRNKVFEVADTGGVAVDSSDWLSKEVERQAFFAADEADVVVMVVDVRMGITEDDQWLSRKIKRSRKHALLVVNKVDNERLELEASEFYGLGMGEPVLVSAYHGLGVGELLERIVEMLPPQTDSEVEPEIAIAVVGRPNVGKSSVVNQIAREERALVHEEPHTTRDSLDTTMTVGGRLYRIVDTAGIRKKRTGMSDIEYYSSIRTFRAIDESDVVLLIVDGSEGPTEHDQRLASKIESRGRPAIILVNKWDLVKGADNQEEVMEAIYHKFRFAQHLPVMRASALTGRGMDDVIPLVKDIYDEWRKRIPTPSLNDLLSEVKLSGPPPAKGGKRLKMYYSTQVETAPPKMVIFVNDASLVNEAYRRYITRMIRERYGFWGTPVRLQFRTASGGREG